MTRIKPHPVRIPTYERKRPKEFSASKRQQHMNTTGSDSRSGSIGDTQNSAMSSGFRVRKDTWAVESFSIVKESLISHNGL